MAEDRFDIVIFGASGYTGQYVVEEVARIAEGEGLTWAVSGRSMEKLQKVMAQASKQTGKELESTEIIIADTGNYDSLMEMAKKAKVVLNCVGPYRFYGEQVVKACIEGGASQLDISGEPQYMEKMQLMHHAEAKKSKVYVVSACGFDSIPAEFGVIHAAQKFNGEVNSVESFMEIHTGSAGIAVNSGTLESAIHGFLHAGELKALRKSLFPEPLPPYKYKIEKRSACFKSDITDKWCTPFMGSDKSVVHRTQRFNHETGKAKPIQFSPYMCLANFKQLILSVLFGIMFAVMSRFGFTRNLLMKYPSFFTAGLFKKGGPSRKQIEQTSFSLTFVAKGWSTKGDHDTAPDTINITKVVGPEPGYVTTPICLVQAAVVLLKEKDKLPEDGGVYSPGASFQDTTLLKRLNDHHLVFSEVTK